MLIKIWYGKRSNVQNAIDDTDMSTLNDMGNSYGKFVFNIKLCDTDGDMLTGNHMGSSYWRFLVYSKISNADGDMYTNRKSYKKFKWKISIQYYNF